MIDEGKTGMVGDDAGDGCGILHRVRVSCSPCVSEHQEPGMAVLRGWTWNHHVSGRSQFRRREMIVQL